MTTTTDRRVRKFSITASEWCVIDAIRLFFGSTAYRLRWYADNQGFYLISSENWDADDPDPWQKIRQEPSELSDLKLAADKVHQWLEELTEDQKYFMYYTLREVRAEPNDPGMEFTGFQAMNRKGHPRQLHIFPAWV